MPTFDTILIANRGEIACRVIRSARALGYRSVAVYSEADAGAPHMRLADAALCIGGAEAKQSYLNPDALLAAARQSGAQAIHPGYGFLSENAEFAAAVAAAGLVFIGPPAAAIAAMGNKAAAKRRMIEAGVPCVPGYQGEDQSDAALFSEAQRIGLPVMVKAAAGGGGRGMRLVHEPAALLAAIQGARSEAENAFGSGELILEKAVIDARHVEIQVFADSQGHVIHLGERDCSVQRRHQKVIEEAPSPAVNADLRARMGAAAVAAARAIGYVGAGTVEFLLDGNGRDFYFLEMNTRLQVEHPVTEAITGLDLVAMQIAVAAGQPLPLALQDVALNGHAIEVRLYAEAPHQGFLPQSGRLALWQPPLGLEGIRVDHGLSQGQEITPYYDPMIAKIIAHGPDRATALRRLLRALEQTGALGIATNRGFLIDLLSHAEFTKGAASTGFIPQYFAEIAAPRPDARAIALAAVLCYARAARACGHDPALAWSSNGVLAAPFELGCNDESLKGEILPLGPAGYRIKLNGAALDITLPAANRAVIAGEAMDYTAVFDGDDLLLKLGALDLRLSDQLYRPRGGDVALGEAELRAPMNGRIVAVLAEAGASVVKGQRIVILEAMKMQHEVTARRDGVLDSVPVKPGDQVATRQLLAALKPLDAGA